jgi:hypothetical protein
MNYLYSQGFIVSLQQIIYAFLKHLSTDNFEFEFAGIPAGRGVGLKGWKIPDFGRIIGKAD